MYEHKSEPLLSRAAFARRMGLSVVGAACIMVLALVGGTAGYHFTEGLAWLDAFLNASMILGGMGPVDRMQTEAGKVFASGYALVSAFVLLSAGAFIVGPVLHRMFHAMHLEGSDDKGE
jgi:hypothetical protein